MATRTFFLRIRSLSIVYVSRARMGAYAPPFSGGAYFRENVESYRAKSAIAGRGASLPCRGGPPPDSVFLFVQMLCQECLVGQCVRQLQQYPLEAAGIYFWRRLLERGGSRRTSWTG